MDWQRILGVTFISTLLGCGAGAAASSTQAAPSQGAEGCGYMQGGGWHAGMGKHGGGMGARGMGKHGDGGAMDASMEKDRALFHYLLDHRQSIQRQVTRLPDGVSTLTESDDPAVAQKIREHAESMHERLLEKRPIHMRDPLFAAIFANADKVKMALEPTPKGVRAIETSTDPQVAAMIQAHADVVSAFLKNGYEEVQKNHPVPQP